MVKRNGDIIITALLSWISGEEIFHRCQDLAQCSDEIDRLGRYYLTPGHRAAIELVSGWMHDAGMATHVDAAGNLVGRYEGDITEARTILMGSHLDTVRDGGRYDGMLGILTAIAVVDVLNKAGERLPYALEVIAFGDEEGVRFNATLIGSRALAGTLDMTVLGKTDATGMSLAEALADFGLDTTQLPRVARSSNDTAAYIEVHIEQGPVLEQEALPVGVVTAIFGATRRSYHLTGKAGHAGTVPMDLRHDALAGAAEAILAIEASARSHGVVATVGRLDCRPGAVNVIPGAVAFTLDLRSACNASKQRALEDINAQLTAIAERRGLQLTGETLHDGAACPMDNRLSAVLAQAIERAGLPVRHLPSGAGHDAMAMVDLCPSAMLFVRCEGGISHNPAENITADDAGVAARVLLDAVMLLAEKDF